MALTEYHGEQSETQKRFVMFQRRRVCRLRLLRCFRAVRLCPFPLRLADFTDLRVVVFFFPFPLLLFWVLLGVDTAGRGVEGTRAGARITSVWH